MLLFLMDEKVVGIWNLLPLGVELHNKHRRIEASSGEMRLMDMGINTFHKLTEALS